MRGERQVMEKRVATPQNSPHMASNSLPSPPSIDFRLSNLETIVMFLQAENQRLLKKTHILEVKAGLRLEGVLRSSARRWRTALSPAACCR